MDASARSCGRWSFTEPLTDLAVRYSEQVPSKRTLPLTLFKDAREQPPVISSLPFVAETSRLSVRRRVRTIFPFAACMRQLDAERESPVILPFVAEISGVEGIKPGRAVQRAERQLLYGGRHLEGEHLFLVIIAEKMFPEYGRDELFLSQTERIALNACFEAVRIEVAGKVKLNRSGSARSKVGRSVPQGDFHSGDGGGRVVRVVRMCFFRIGVDFLLWQHVCNRLLRCGIFLTEKFEDIVDIAEFRTDFFIGETLAAGVGEMGFEIV